MPMVHDLYFHPQQDAFLPRNLWSLSNAFTSAFKKLIPIKQFEVTARLGTFLSLVQMSHQKEEVLNFELQKDNRLVQIDDYRKKNEPFDYKLSTNEQTENETTYFTNENFQDENFDVDDIAEDPEEEFDEYFDAEEESEMIDEAEEQFIEEFERRMATAA